MPTQNCSLRKFTCAIAVTLLLPGLGTVHGQSWRLIGISGQQGNSTPDGLGGFLYPDHTLFEIDPASGAVLPLFQATFVNDSQSIGYCPADGLLYHTGGSESYSNNPLRTGNDQGGPTIFGVGYQDSQYMESIDLQNGIFNPIFNAAPCPNPDPTLPCFGLVAPRPTWVLPAVQRDSTQTGDEFRARGEDEYHAVRGMAWSASKNLFYVADEDGIFKITTAGDSKFLARPAFPVDGKVDESKAILVIPETLLVGHRDGSGAYGYLMEVDAETGKVRRDLALQYPSGGGDPVDTFGGLLGLAQHPETGEIYGIRQTSDPFARELVTINLRTGETTLITYMGMHISSIAFVPSQDPLSPWILIGISGQQGNSTPDGLGGFLYPDHTLFEIDPASGTLLPLFQATFVNDSQSIGYCPADGLLYHTGGSESYSNNPLRTGNDQGGPTIFGVGYQDSQYMESIDLQNEIFHPIFNAAPCPNPDPTLPCFGLVAPRPGWVLPAVQRDSTQTGDQYRARGENEYHAVRGMAWSASKNLFYVADEDGIFKITPTGDSKFLSRPAFPVDGAVDESKAILVIPERLLVGHRDGSGANGYIMEVDAATGKVLGDLPLNYPAGGGDPVDTFGGLLGLAQHPETGEIFGIRQTSDPFARELVTIDLRTGDTTLIIYMGMHISGIAFVQEPPLKITSITRNGNDLKIVWSGGKPPYQLQTRANFSTGSWSDVGAPTSDLSATVTISGREGYFQVLGQ